MIKEVREKGMSITDISKKMGISRPTVRKYLREYFKRNALESGFSSDKRTTGNIVYQWRNDRKETSGLCKGLIHNLMLSHG